MIIEMAGRPANHVRDSLTKHVGVLENVKDVEVNSINVSEPKEIEMPKDAPKQEPVFTCFAEVDFGVENFSRVSDMVFDFMPSSIEVIEPSRVSFDAAEATSLLNVISGRMHKYDEVAKIAGARLNQMGAQLQAAQQALIEKDMRNKTPRGGRKSGVKSKKKGSKRVKKK